MSYLSEQKKQIKIQESINQVEDELVSAIQAALDNKKSYGDLEESQFRNLLRVADTTESTEVIKNFLRYQVGRDKKWGRGENSLAAKIVQDIDSKIKELANKIALEAQIDDFNPIWLELTRRYLEYGARYLQLINSSHLIQIEESISRLSSQEQLWLVERIIHNLTLSALKNTSNLRLDSVEQQLVNMANDPTIQAELIAINQEFAATEMDGLVEQ